MSLRVSHAGQPVFEPAWVPQVADVSVMTMAAAAAARITLHEPTSYDPAETLPTPTPARWAAITAAASKALVALHWHKNHRHESNFPGEPSDLHLDTIQ